MGDGILYVLLYDIIIKKNNLKIALKQWCDFILNFCSTFYV